MVLNNIKCGTQLALALLFLLVGTVRADDNYSRFINRREVFFTAEVKSAIISDMKAKLKLSYDADVRYPRLTLLGKDRNHRSYLLDCEYCPKEANKCASSDYKKILVREEVFYGSEYNRWGYKDIDKTTTEVFLKAD